MERTVKKKSKNAVRKQSSLQIYRGKKNKLQTMRSALDVSFGFFFSFGGGMRHACRDGKCKVERSNYAIAWYNCIVRARAAT